MTESLLTNHTNHVVVVPAKAREKKVEQIEPPDGGSRAYLVMISAFLCNGILFGIINTYSVIYLSLQRQLKESGDEAASSKACKFCEFFLREIVNIIVAGLKNDELKGFLRFLRFLRFSQVNRAQKRKCKKQR